MAPLFATNCLHMHTLQHGLLSTCWEQWCAEQESMRSSSTGISCLQLQLMRPGWLEGRCERVTDLILACPAVAACIAACVATSSMCTPCPADQLPSALHNVACDDSVMWPKVRGLHWSQCRVVLLLLQHRAHPGHLGIVHVWHSQESDC